MLFRWIAGEYLGSPPACIVQDNVSAPAALSLVDCVRTCGSEVSRIANREPPKRDAAAPAALSLVECGRTCGSELS